jgi:retron-type reverse transcriptase
MQYKELCSLNNVFRAWRLFSAGKRTQVSVQCFERHLEDNLITLHDDLQGHMYCHGGYRYTVIHDRKKRDIHTASVRDRVVHRMVFEYLKTVLEPIFLPETFASRTGKGSHRAAERFSYACCMCGPRAHVLSCDVRKYFQSIRHDVLLTLLAKHIPDQRIFDLCENIISSFSYSSGCGIPLGNVTSQIFATLYLHDVDVFIKQMLGVRWYVRYNDDMVLLHDNPRTFLRWKGEIQNRCRHIGLLIPDEKCRADRVADGVEFLGWRITDKVVLFPKHSERAILSRVNRCNHGSYLGLTQHAKAYTLRSKIYARIYSEDDDIVFV